MEYAETEDVCNQIAENDRIPRKRIVIETKKTTTTTTTTRREYYVDDSNVSMSEIQALLDEDDEIPAIENVVDVKAEVVDNVHRNDDIEPLFSSTKLDESLPSKSLVNTPHDKLDAIESDKNASKKSCDKLAQKSSGKSAKKVAKTKSVSKVEKSKSSSSKKLSNKKSEQSHPGSTNKSIKRKSNVREIGRPDKRYPSRSSQQSSTTTTTNNMAKIATKKEPKRRSAIDQLVNQYASMVKSHHNATTSKNEKPPPPPPPPQTTEVASHELSAILENPDESMESRAYEEEEVALRTAELEHSYPDELTDNVEHLLDEYNVDVPSVKIDLDVLQAHRKGGRKAKSESIDHISKSKRSGRVNKSSRKTIATKNDKLKKAVAELATNQIKPSKIAKQSRATKAVVEDTSGQGNSKLGKNDAKNSKNDKNGKAANKKQSSKAKETKQTVASEVEEMRPTAEPIDSIDPFDAVAQKENVANNKRKSDPKHTRKSDPKPTKNGRTGKKSQKTPMSTNNDNNIEMLAMDEFPKDTIDPFDAIAHNEDAVNNRRQSDPKPAKEDKPRKKSETISKKSLDSKATKQPKKSTEKKTSLPLTTKGKQSLDTIDPFDAIAQKENVSNNKRESDPKPAKKVKTSEKSETISKKSLDSAANKATKHRKSFEKISSPPPTIKDSRLHALDNKSIKIYSPSCRGRFKATHGNHIKISKAAIEQAIVKNCKSSKNVLKTFHAHDVEVEGHDRLFIIPGQELKPISREEEENMDPLALARARSNARTLIVREI